VTRSGLTLTLSICIPCPEPVWCRRGQASPGPATVGLRLDERARLVLAGARACAPLLSSPEVAPRALWVQARTASGCRGNTVAACVCKVYVLGVCWKQYALMRRAPRCPPAPKKS